MMPCRFPFFLVVVLAVNAATVMSQTEDPAGRLHYTTNDYETPEPFPYLHGHCSDGSPPHPESPDPLVRTTWSSSVNASALQVYRVYHPINYQVAPIDAITGIEALLTGSCTRNQKPVESNDDTSCTIQVHKTASLMLDWGVERAAWLEFTLDGQEATPNISMRASLSEFNVPYPGKTKPVVAYGNHTYRLETNDELYEGVRFTWIYFDFENDDDPPLRISNISLVAKIKPVNYTGSYVSSDQELTTVWYTGAYAVRL